jgi:hypothetical protein
MEIVACEDHEAQPLTANRTTLVVISVGRDTVSKSPIVTWQVSQFCVSECRPWRTFDYNKNQEAANDHEGYS